MSNQADNSHVISYRGLHLPTRWHLSPLAGFTNLPFRRIVRELGGVGLATTDLVNARALLEGREKSFELIETTPDDRPFAVQIFGGDPSVMRDAAQLLMARGVDSIDINMGCPVDHVTKTGAGSKLMCDPRATVALVETVVNSVRLPVTVKMRLGWDEDHISAPRFAREFEQVGVAAIAIHGRTRAQGFSGSVSLEGIRQVVEAVESIPVVGNGDVRTVEDAVRMREVTGCQAVSIGRGALANPWIFRQLWEFERTGQYGPSGGFDARMGLLLKQFQYLEERHGADLAILRFRKMAHWYVKGMRVRASLRHQLQLAQTRSEFEAAIEAIRHAGPIGGDRLNELPTLQVPVPSGPNERW